jgi:response regulator RpfG family c-di-GMP phosphodiesterase
MSPSDGSAARSSTNGSRPRILCVDDEPLVLEGLRDTLRRSFDVRVATSAADGLELLRADPDAYAVVISDMRMPVKAGDVFLREARTVAPDAVRMLLTGYADLDSAIRAVNGAQLFRFLTKPCAPDELLRACAVALGQHRMITAERVLLEQTLRGSIDALYRTLALANPAAFGRSGRIKQLAGRLAAAAELDDRWEIEVAAMLDQIGAVTLPHATAEKLYSGEPLSSAEQQMVDRVPAITRSLISTIPRLDGVLGILDGRHVTPEPGDDAALEALPVGARVLRIAADYDELETRGATAAVALGAMGGRRIYDRRLLELLSRIAGVGARPPAVAEIPMLALRVGMMLADDVRHSSGSLLVARGHTVNDQLIDRLDNLPSGSVREPIRVFGPEDR